MKATKGRGLWKELTVFVIVVATLSVAWLWQRNQVRDTEAFIRKLDAEDSTSAAKAARIRDLRASEAATNK